MFKLSRVIDNPRELILAKAKEIICSEGYSKLSMRTISKACNIATGTIYNYYPTKKDIVTEIMTDYWQEYYDSAQKLSATSEAFYEKLNKIFIELRSFLKTFKDVWLKPEIYDYPDFIESSKEKQSFYLEKLILLIEDMLLKEIGNDLNPNISSYELSKFIVMNFISLVQMPMLEYSSFELILKELL